MADNPDIWYATNGEIYAYIEAARQIVSSVDGQLLYNPTARTLYLEISGEKKLLEPDQTLDLTRI